MPKERNRLTDLEVAEVSLVGKPANQRSFLVFKEEEGGNKQMPDVNEKILEILQEELPENIVSQLEDGELEQLAEEELEALRSAIKLLRAYKQELPENVLETLAELAELKLPETEVEEVTSQDEDEKIMSKKMLKGYPEPVKKADGSFDLSGVPKEQRAIIEALWKQAERSELLEKELKDERDQRLIKQYIEKAESFSNLPIKASEIGPVFKTLAEKAPKEFEKIDSLLKAVDEALGQSKLYKEIGSNHQGPSNAWAKVEQLAMQIVRKDSGLTKEQAITKVLEENPALYSEYLAEKR